MKALSADEVARELGMSRRTLQRRQDELIARHGMPPPMPYGSAPAWNRAAFYAWLDRDLPEPMKIAASAYRAAAAAASVAVSEPAGAGLDGDAVEIARWQSRLDREFAQ